jgi:hypothetical protein
MPSVSVTLNVQVVDQNAHFKNLSILLFCSWFSL